MIAVLTTPRRPQYVAATLRALDRAGALTASPKVVCVDGAVREMLRARAVPTGWEIISLGNNLGSRAAFKLVCAMVAKRGGPSDLLYFEDDITPCLNAVAALEIIPVPADCGFLAAFDHKNLAIKLAGPEGDTPRILRLAADDPAHRGAFWGNQALKIPRRTVEHLAQQRTDQTFNAGSPTLLYGSDVWLGQYAASKSAPWHRYGLLSPSLFQHVGAISAVKAHWKLHGRVARNWRAAFDALSLPGLLR